MDHIYEMSVACEAFFKSTERSRNKYKKYIDKQKTWVNERIAEYEEYLEKCDKLAQDIEKLGLTTGKEISQYIQKNGQDILDDFIYGGLPTDPMFIIDAYKNSIKTLRYRADRKHPEMQEFLNAINREVSENGEIYKAVKKIKDRMEGDVAASGTKNAKMKSAQLATANALIQQELANQLQQQQLEQEIQRQIQLDMMHQMQEMQFQAQQSSMSAMGMM